MKTVHIIASVSVASLAWSVVAFAEEAPAAEHSKITWEDLPACKLPNMKMVLPGQGTALARKGGGTVFSFATRTFSPEPDFDEEEFTVQKFITALKGDIYYAVPENGCFVVTSGRIADLGKHYLHEFDGKNLPRPDIMITKEDGYDVPGLLTGIEERTEHCFLLETKDSKAVLLRIVSQDRKRGEAVVQWVYQPDGTRRFAIPKGKIIIATPRGGNNQRASGPPVRIDIPQLDAREFIKAAKVHLENRRKIVDLSIKLICAEDTDLSSRRLAVVLLGQLRASEGAVHLAARIDENLASKSTELTVSGNYRCVEALIEIGIPGAIASVNQIKSDAQSDPRKDGDSRRLSNRIELRRNLLSLVVLKVYGEKLATVVLQDEIAQAEDPKVKEAFQKALDAFPRIRNWLPDEKSTTTAPAATSPTK